MSAHTSRGTYIAILLVLAFLTAIELMVPHVFQAEWDQTLKMVLLVGLAVSKATLVALFFMHLKSERPWIKRIAMVPAYMGILVIVLMLEVTFR